MKHLYVVAVSQKEAEELAGEIGHVTLAEACKHLSEVVLPPTDHHYAKQYRVWRVRATEDARKVQP
jgi:hypothetical protein